MPTGITKTITLSSGKTATIAQLTWTEMKKARKAASIEQVDGMRQLGGELLRAFRDMKSPEEANAAVDALEAKAKVEQQKALENPTNYDMEVVLGAGVIDIDGKQPEIVTMNEPTAEELRTAIIAYSRDRGDSPNA